MRVWGVISLAIFAALANVPEAKAASWNQDGGNGLFIFGSNLTTASEFFDNSRDAQPLTNFEKTEIRAYLEYGLSPKWTFVGNGAWQKIAFETDRSAFKFDGLDQTALGFQYQLKRRAGLSMSMRASYIVDGGPDATLADVLPGGDAIELRALLGQSRETVVGDFFQDVQVAAQTRTGSRLDTVQGDWTVGYKPTYRNMLLVQSFVTYAPSDRIEDFKINPQLQVTGKLSYARQVRPGRWVQIGVERTLAGQNIVRETALTTGLWTEF